IWLVLNDLQQLIAVDDRAWRRCDVDAKLEARLVDLRRQPAILGEIAQIVLKSAPQTFSAGIEELPHRGRIAHGHVCGRSGVDEDIRNQASARLVDFAETRFIDEAVQGVAPGEIGLKQSAMKPAIFPCWVGKALVASLLNAIGLARADPPDLAEKRQPLAAGDGRLVDQRLEEDAGAVHQVLAAQANQRV